MARATKRKSSRSKSKAATSKRGTRRAAPAKRRGKVTTARKAKKGALSRLLSSLPLVS